MCINTEAQPKTCCCGCSLGCGVLVFGILEALALLSYIGVGDVWMITFQSILCVLFLLIAAQKDNPDIVKIVYYIYAVGVGLYLIGLVVMMCLSGMIIDSAIEVCQSEQDPNAPAVDCDSVITVAFWTGLALSAAIAVPIKVFCTRVMYFFWQERAEKRGDYKAI